MPNVYGMQNGTQNLTKGEAARQKAAGYKDLAATMKSDRAWSGGLSREQKTQAMIISRKVPRGKD